MPRALILKFGSIGDVLMAIPGVHRLHLAGHEIDWICGPGVLPLLELYPWIHATVLDERGLLTGNAATRLRIITALWRQLAGRSYAVVATLYYDPRYRLLTLPVRAERKILLSHTDRALRLLPGRHHTDEFARILLGWPDEHRHLPLSPLPAPTENLPPSPLRRNRKPRILLAPAGARNLMADDVLRRWQPENYVALTRLLLERGMEVVLIGGPDDTWIQPRFADLPIEDLIGRLALPETLALLEAGDILVTHDTGPLHMAGITRAGIVSIFGPTDPRGRLPQRPGTVALWGGEGFACRPCYDGHSFAPCPANLCMAQVTPGMVLAEILLLLEARHLGTSPPPKVVTPTSTVASLVQSGAQNARF